MAKSEAMPLMQWAERQRKNFLAGEEDKRAKPKPFRRTDVKWGIKASGIRFKKRGKRLLQCNLVTGEVLVYLRRDNRLMKNSPLNRSPA